MQTIELTGTDCPLCDKTCKTLAGRSYECKRNDRSKLLE